MHPLNSYPRLRFLCLAIAVCGVTVLVAACGGGSSSSSSADTTSGGNASASSSQSGSSELSGKTIGYLDIDATAPIEIRFQKAFKEAADKFGWSVTMQDAAGEPEKALAGARSLIASNVDGIVAADIPSEWLMPIAAEAKEKGIPIIEQGSLEPPGLFTTQIVDSQEATSKALAEQIESDNPNGAEVAITYTEELTSLFERKKDLEQDFKGTNIKVVASENVPIPENPKAQKFTTDTLTAHPNLTAIIATSDIQSPEVLAGLRTAGNSKVKVYGWYADSANAETMKANPKQFAAVVDADSAKMCWMIAGELANLFTGGKVVKEIQEPSVNPVIVKPTELTPGMFAEEGPVPFAELGAPFYKEWEEKYGI